jgi:DNA repair protein RecN (Recombination protein N)
MLEFLSIKGFAIIDELQLPFKPGLTVLTGETGAGKSIIVDALQTVLGEKVDLSVVRTGESTARVEAMFKAPEMELPDGFDALDEMIIGREIRREGRGRTTVNGAMITIPHLKEIGDSSQGDRGPDGGSPRPARAPVPAENLRSPEGPGFLRVPG